MSRFTSEYLGHSTWKVVENDHYGQYPFLYVIVGSDKCVLIDTGCDTDDFKTYVSTTINTEAKPYLVICTHVHFDHTGGNHRFTPGSDDCIDICMSARDKTFTNNVEINSLCLAHNTAMKAFTVSRWLEDGDEIPLDDTNPTEAETLRVIWSPGHTADSISIYYPGGRRLFVGDNLYPFTTVHLDCIGSNTQDFVTTLDTLMKFVAEANDALPPPEAEEEEDIPAVPVAVPMETAPAPPPPSSGGGGGGGGGGGEYDAAIAQFCGLVGLDAEVAASQFDLNGFMQICDGSAGQAVQMYFEYGAEGVAQLAPPKAQPTGGGPAGDVSGGAHTQSGGSVLADTSGGIVLSCGHVEANLGSDSLGLVKGLVEAVLAGALPPLYSEDGYGEYNSGNFTIMMPLPK